MINVQITFTTVAEAAAFFTAASGAAPASTLPTIVEPPTPVPAPKAQHTRPPTEPKVTVPNEPAKAAAPAAAPAGAAATPATPAATAGSSQAGAPAFDRKAVSQSIIALASRDMAKASALLAEYGAARGKDLTDEQAADIHPKVLAALAG